MFHLAGDLSCYPISGLIKEKGEFKLKISINKIFHCLIDEQFINWSKRIQTEIIRKENNNYTCLLQYQIELIFNRRIEFLFLFNFFFFILSWSSRKMVFTMFKHSKSIQQNIRRLYTLCVHMFFSLYLQHIHLVLVFCIFLWNKRIFFSSSQNTGYPVMVLCCVPRNEKYNNVWCKRNQSTFAMLSTLSVALSTFLFFLFFCILVTHCLALWSVKFYTFGFEWIYRIFKMKKKIFLFVDAWNINEYCFDWIINFRKFRWILLNSWRLEASSFPFLVEIY